MPLSKYFCLKLSTLRNTGLREHNVHNRRACLSVPTQLPCCACVGALEESKTSWAKAGEFSLPALSSAFRVSWQTCFWAFSSSPLIPPSVGWVQRVLWISGRRAPMRFCKSELLVLLVHLQVLLARSPGCWPVVSPPWSSLDVTWQLMLNFWNLPGKL